MLLPWVDLSSEALTISLDHHFIASVSFYSGYTMS